MEHYMPFREFMTKLPSHILHEELIAGFTNKKRLKWVEQEKGGVCWIFDRKNFTLHHADTADCVDLPNCMFRIDETGIIFIKHRQNNEDWMFKVYVAESVF